MLCWIWDRLRLWDPSVHVYRDTPLYVLKGPVDTEGAVRLLSLIKKSYLGFRTHDPVETPRLSLRAARKEVAGSLGVIAHLLSPNRAAAHAHNALCAFVCGMAVAEQRPVLLLQEESVPQPIDYRDLVKTYRHPDQIEVLLRDVLHQVVERLQYDPLAQVCAARGAVTGAKISAISPPRMRSAG